MPPTGDTGPDGEDLRAWVGFDHGDVLWARAFVCFQRAALEIVLAYDWRAVDQVLAACARRASTGQRPGIRWCSCYRDESRS